MSQPIPITPEQPPQFPCWLWSDNRAERAEERNQWRHYLHSPCGGYSGPYFWFTHWHPDQPDAPTERPDEPQPFGAYERSQAITEEMNASTQPVPQWTVEAAKEINVALSGILTADTIGALAAIIARHAPQPAPAGVSDTEMLDWLAVDPHKRIRSVESSISSTLGNPKLDPLRQTILAEMRAEKEGL